MFYLKLQIAQTISLKIQSVNKKFVGTVQERKSNPPTKQAKTCKACLFKRFWWYQHVTGTFEFNFVKFSQGRYNSWTKQFPPPNFFWTKVPSKIYIWWWLAKSAKDVSKKNKLTPSFSSDKNYFHTNQTFLFHNPYEK